MEGSKGFAVQLEKHIRILSKGIIAFYPDSAAIIVPAVIAYEVLADKHETVVGNISLHFEIVMNSCFKLRILIRGYYTRNLVYIV